MADSKPTATELQRRLVYTALRPVVRLARRFRFPLKSLLELTRLAYFEELRRGHGWSQTRIAEVFDKSLRTITSLEKQLKSDFLAPQRSVELERRVEGACAAPRTAIEVAAEIGEPEVDVARTLDGLVGSGRVHKDGERYVLVRGHQTLMDATLPSRLDGLTHQLDVVADTVVARFLTQGEPALARTLSFLGTDATIEALSDELAQVVRALVGEAEEAALKSGERPRPFAITVALAAQFKENNKET